MKRKSYAFKKKRFFIRLRIIIQNRERCDSIMQKKIILKVFGKLFAFTFVTALIIVGSIVAANNSRSFYSYELGDWDYKYVPTEFNSSRWNVLFDAHSHTTASDGKLSAEQNIQWHISQGYTAMVLTDHSSLANSYIIRDIARTNYNDSIKVLIGQEWSSRRCHLNFIFPPSYTNTTAFKPPATAPTDDEIRAVVQQVHDLGGIVIIDHFPWSIQVAKYQNHPSQALAKSLGIDYIEVVNGADYDVESVNFCDDTGMYQITGTDMHSPYGVYAWTAMNITGDITEQKIFDALKAGQTDVIYNCTASYYDYSAHESVSYKFVKPWILLGQALKVYDLGHGDMDWMGILVVGLYLYGFFFLLEGIKYLGRKFMPKIVTKIQAKQALKTDSPSPETQK